MNPSPLSHHLFIKWGSSRCPQLMEMEERGGWSVEKKSWCAHLSFVNKYVLENKCPSKYTTWLLLIVLVKFIFNCYLAAWWPTLDHYRGGSLTHPMLISSFLHIWSEGYCESCNEVGFLSPAKHLVGFEPGTLWFCLQCLNPLGHCPWMQC